MKTIKLLVVSMTLGWMLSVPCVMAQQTAPADVQQAAVTGLQPLIAKIPAGSAGDYGFAAGDNLATATLGDPFLAYTITSSALDQYRVGMAVASLVTKTTLWYFPVLIAGQPRAMLVVNSLDNRSEAVSLGYAGLAKALGNVSRTWSASKDIMFIDVFQAHQFLFSVPAQGSQNLTRLVTQEPVATGQINAAATPTDDYATLGTAAGIIEQLKPVVKDAIK